MRNNLAKASRLTWRLLTVGLKNPRGLRNVLGHALAASEDHLDRASDPTRVPTITLEEVIQELPGGVNVQVLFRPKIAASVSFYEALALSALLSLCQARRAFEFGTYRGVSSSQIALNLGENGKLFTLDLPPDAAPLKYDLRKPIDIQIAHEKVKGDLIPDELLPRVEFLRADSAAFDETQYLNSMDFVFVDGAHTLEYVRNDSEKGWRMLRPGGIMAWHDCCVGAPGVVKFLLNCSFAPKRITGTTLAFARKS